LGGGYGVLQSTGQGGVVIIHDPRVALTALPIMHMMLSLTKQSTRPEAPGRAFRIA